MPATQSVLERGAAGPGPSDALVELGELATRQLPSGARWARARGNEGPDLRQGGPEVTQQQDRRDEIDRVWVVAPLARDTHGRAEEGVLLVVELLVAPQGRGSHAGALGELADSAHLLVHNCSAS